jgi:hypothetical protein
MNTFPIISSAAVTQYPAVLQYSQTVQVLAFLDGSDQRYQLQPAPLRMWRINLAQLNEDEIQLVENFFMNQQGANSQFLFPDPFTGMNVSNCLFASSTLLTTYVDIDNSSTVCWVIETNG